MIHLNIILILFIINIAMVFAIYYNNFVDDIQTRPSKFSIISILFLGFLVCPMFFIIQLILYLKNCWRNWK